MARVDSPAAPTESAASAPDQNFSVRLHSHANHRRVVRARIEAVDRAIRIQPADEVSRRYAGAAAAEFCEVADDQNLAVGLHRQSFDVVIRARIKTVDCAISIQSRNLAARKSGASATADSSQFSTDHDFAISLYHDSKNCAVFGMRPATGRTRIKGSVDRAVGIQPRDATAHDRAGAPAAESGKTSSNQYFPICL